MSCLRTKYLTEEELKGLHNYKYVSAPVSKSEQALTPFWNFCLNKFIPIWMAPNLVTLLGLIMIIITTLSYLLYD